MCNKHRKQSGKALLLALVLLLATSACGGNKVSPTRIEFASPTPTTGRPATATPTKPSLPTATVPLPTSTLAPTMTPKPTMTPSPTLVITASPTLAALTILKFTVGVEDLAIGKRLTFNWQTTGANKAMIVSGTAQRFMKWWTVEPNGTLTIDLDGTYYRNPAMSLTAYDGRGNEVSRFITVTWPCQYEYFFTPAPDACPLNEATFTQAAEEPFDGGRMIWLKEIRGQSHVVENQILVLYRDSRWVQFQDTWTSSEPESDPTLAPPEGRTQPVRGFGKVWRTNANVKIRLGWALAPEQGFDVALQEQLRESIPGVVYIRTIDNQIVRLDGWGMGSGTWQAVTPP